MSTALDRILDYKRDEVATLKRDRAESDLLAAARSAAPTRPFQQRMLELAASGRNALICEIKRKSPSAGTISEIKDPRDAAKLYQAGGAACISVLTDGPSFGGSLDDMTAVRQAVDIPVMRKDFMMDTAQVLEARAAGADAILIIMAAVDDALARDLSDCASELGMSVLVESHDRQELERALLLPSVLQGVNNRNLKTFTTDLSTTEQLSELVPEDRLLISESGIKTGADVSRLRKCGARGFLVGESLMRSIDTVAAVDVLLMSL